ncbi:matrixin family metalloprotease [Clostridium sp. WILCCON 0269]|uniref:Matrixin family metalloprotease n=1 Tax=Candidatus Clostridium eludens TaxID=3381663 RepID=A0ABW8SKW4_9CLOT
MPSVSWDGLISATASGGYYTSVIISLNMSATNTWNSDGALKSVAVHEFGHGLGLNENGTTKTIMNAYT